MPKYVRNSIDIDAIPIQREPRKALRMNNAIPITRALREMLVQSVHYKALFKFIDKLEQMDAHPALFSAEILGWIYPLTKEGRELSDIVTLAMQVYKHQEFFNLHPKLACLCNFVVKHQLHEMIMDGGTNRDNRML